MLHVIVLFIYVFMYFKNIFQNSFGIAFMCFINYLIWNFFLALRKADYFLCIFQKYLVSCNVNSFWNNIEINVNDISLKCFRYTLFIAILNCHKNFVKGATFKRGFSFSTSRIASRMCFFKGGKPQYVRTSGSSSRGIDFFPFFSHGQNIPFPWINDKVFIREGHWMLNPFKKQQLLQLHLKLKINKLLFFWIPKY